MQRRREMFKAVGLYFSAPAPTIKGPSTASLALQISAAQTASISTSLLNYKHGHHQVSRVPIHPNNVDAQFAPDNESGMTSRRCTDEEVLQKKHSVQTPQPQWTWNFGSATMDE